MRFLILLVELFIKCSPSNVTFIIQILQGLSSWMLDVVGACEISEFGKETIGRMKKHLFGMYFCERENAYQTRVFFFSFPK